jgi:(1->4)-alpha-D-glucan 1-alpha-D-glucosylmutase
MKEIAGRYTDVWGNSKQIDAETRAALQRALGAATGPRSRVVRKRIKASCFQPPILERGGRLWGFSVQLYSLRSARNWGIGDFTDLGALVELSAGLGAALVGVNPLHAGGLSPYSPSSRHALSELYLDVEAIPEFAGCRPAQRLAASAGFRARLEALRNASLVDYEGVRRAKLELLEVIFKNCLAADGKYFLKKKIPIAVSRYALFQALAEAFGLPWQRWPAQYRNPRSAAVAAFARKHAKRVAFHEFIQRNARLQLEAVQRRALGLGMPIGLYVDLALGADAGGAETWNDQAVFAESMSCGAPPDEFNPRGQDWGLPPYSPRALAAAGYAPFRELLRANMPEGGALRMDHVMSLMRLWWIPRGAGPAGGGYVRYPFRDLLAVLAEESRQRRCLVVGEDLGTVPAQLRKALNEAGVLSYRPLLFEKDARGAFRAPQDYPREALTCLSTHDLPTWQGFMQARDLELRTQLHLSVHPDEELRQRETDKRNLLAALRGQDLDDTAASAHLFLARTPCKIMMVQPEDVFELAEQANLPGSVEGHPNWRRKLPVPHERWSADERVASLAGLLAPWRPMGKRIPRATYRLQLNKSFGFAQARALVPYLERLGVSHLYASPFLKARAGSMHGYDIIDHASVNPEIGTRAGLDALIGELERRGMGLVLDVVPNHMGVLEAENPWWLDVLENGQASRYAGYFDIDWNPAKPELRGKVLLAVLGSHYGEALEKGELRLVREQGKWRVGYYDHRFPLSGVTQDFLSGKKKFSAKSTNALELHQLLERQHYRLAYWRVASDEINYRRFFEITGLAALRVEDREVFEASHALIARLCAHPAVDGLRIDHPDGLADPQVYFERLRELCGRPWIVLEKILAGYEKLPADWQVQGTTGYRFANVLTGLFVDAAAEGRFDRIYRRFTGEARSCEAIAYESRMLIMGTTLAAELNMLANRLTRIAAGNRFTRDYTAGGLRRALAEIAARFPVYRSYVTERGASDTDRRDIDWAVSKARRTSPAADPSVFDFVRCVLTLDAAPPEGARREAMVAFVTRFQQFTAPVVAKGDEDTAFYRYNRLAALNEVGGDPRNFGFSLKAFHAASEDRARHWPHTLIGSSTHDTKRSEDARARLCVLSELPSLWRLWLRRWSLLNRSHRTELEGVAAPSRSDEYLYYQLLLAIWPLDARPAETSSARALAALKERIQAGMLKSVREAKLRTSWINPDAGYEAALAAFIDGSLSNALFLKDLGEALARIARLGALVSLSQALLKVASPGVPDYYQGTELLDFSLVDPDNRRPVDYGTRNRFLMEIHLRFPGKDLPKDLADGKAKLLVIAKGLELRRRMPELFFHPVYMPLYADSGREENVCAFALRQGPRTLVAIAPRLFAGLMDGEDYAPLGERAWGEACLGLPGMTGEFENLLTGKRHSAGEQGLRLAEVLGSFPVALLLATPGQPKPRRP